MNFFSFATLAAAEMDDRRQFDARHLDPQVQVRITAGDLSWSIGEGRTTLSPLFRARHAIKN